MFAETKLGVFYDLDFYNSDTCNVPNTFNLKAELYFRFAASQKTHVRKVTQLYAYLGGISGMEVMLMRWISKYLGALIGFFSKM